MVITETKYPKIKFVEGDIFLPDEYGADALLVFYYGDFHPLERGAVLYNGKRLMQQRFIKENHLRRNIRSLLWHSLDKLAEEGYKNIVLHCSVRVKDSAIAGAYVAYEAIQMWFDKRPNTSIESVMLVDKHSDYSMFLDEERCKQIIDQYALNEREPKTRYTHNKK